MHSNTRARIQRRLGTRPSLEIDKLLRRISCEFELAKGFISAYEKIDHARAQVWRHAYQKASSVMDRLDPKSAEELGVYIQHVEQELAFIGEEAKNYRIHCVGHGHIDMNWMWSWPETVSMTHDTFASVLSLMEQYPELTYSQSQASVYAAIEKYHPEMFEQIKQRVKEGRWEVTAVHWVEGDKNIAGGEALCRHLLYTRGYFWEKFGLRPEDVTIDWEPDTFGHAHTVPMILTDGGVKYYYSCRTGGGFDHVRVGDERPPLFWWKSPDGSKILVNKELSWYNSYCNIGDNIAEPMTRMVASNGLHEWLNVYGIGNHGGGPTRTEIDYYKEMQEWPIYPQIVFSTARRYFDAVFDEMKSRKIELPVLDHELNFEFTGCYTSQSLIKQANRLGESYCLEAETLDALTGLGRSEQLREAWINVLFNHFHDILPGSGVRETREHARALFQETGAITGAVKREALKKLGSRINTLALLPKSPEADEEKAELEGVRLGESGPLYSIPVSINTPFVAGTGMGAGLTGFSQATSGGKRFKPYMVWNPCAWTRTEPVTVALYDTGFDKSRIVAIDDQGGIHPCFFISRDEAWGHDRITVMFYAADVPGLGYRTYLFCEGEPTVQAEGVKAHSNELFSSATLSADFSRHMSGAKVTFGDRILSHIGAWKSVLEYDKVMSAWVLGGEIDEPKSLVSNSFRSYGGSWNVATLQAEGPDSMAYRIESTLKVAGTDSSVKLVGWVHGCLPRIDFEATIDWREIGAKDRGIPGLTICFGPFEAAGDFVYENPFGTIARAYRDGEEVPSLRFVHVPFEDGGVTIVQDGRNGFSRHNDELRMRVVRSSFDPDHAPEVAIQTLRYSVVFHDRPASHAELVKLGAAWNHPFIVSPLNMQTGNGPGSFGAIEVGNSNVVVTSVKAAQDGNGVIARFVNYSGSDTASKVRFANSFEKASLVDVLERTIETDLVVEGRSVTVPIRARGFASVRLS